MRNGSWRSWILGVMFFTALLSQAAHAQEAETPPPPPQLQYLEGHKAAVYAVAYSPDGKTMVSGSVDGSVHVWDRASGALIRTIKDSNGPILTVAISADGLQLACAGLDRNIRVYDLPSQHPKDEIAIPAVPAKVAINAEGSLLVSSFPSKIVRVWNAATKQHLRDLAGSTEETTALAIVRAVKPVPAPKEGEEVVEAEPVYLSKYAVSASADGVIRGWQLADGVAAGVIYSTPQNAITAPTSGKWLAGAGQDGLLRLFQWPVQPPLSMPGHADIVTAVAISRDGKTILSGSNDLKVNLSNSVDGKAKFALVGQEGKVTSVALDRSGQHAASGSDTGLVKLWTTEDGKPVSGLAGHVGAVTGVDFHPTEKQLATSGADGTVRVWNFPVAPRLLAGHATGIDSLAVAPDGKTAATTSSDKTLRVWDLAEGKAVRTAKGLPRIYSTRFSHSGKQLATGDETGMITLQAAADGATQGALGAHVGAVSGLAYHPKDNLLVSSGADGLVKLWDLPLVEPKVFADHKAVISGVAVAPDGKWAVSASGTANLLVFDPATGKVVRKLEGQVGPVTSLILDPQATTIATGGNDGAIRLWNAADGEAMPGVAGHEGAVGAIAFHPKEPQFATAGADGTVRVWNRPIAAKELAAHEKPVSTIAVSADRKTALTGSADGVAKLWTLADGKPGKVLQGHESAVRSAAFSKDGAAVATGDVQGNIKLWSPADGKNLATLLGHEGAVTGVAFHPTTPLMASSGADGTVKLWQLPIAPSLSLGKHAGAATVVAVTPDGLLSLSGGADQAVQIVDLVSGKLVRTLADLPGAVTSLAVSFDNKLAAVGTKSGSVRIYNIADGAPVATLAGHKASVTGLTMHPKGGQIVSVAADGSIRVWALPVSPKTLAGHTAAVHQVSVSPNGQLVATASADKAVRIRKIVDGAEVWTLGHAAAVTSLAWKADGSQLVTGSAAGNVRIWNATDGKQVAIFKGQKGPIGGVAMTPDGATVVSGGADNSIKLWNVAENKESSTIAGHTKPVTALALLSGGAVIVSGSKDGTVRTWNAADGKQVLNINRASPVTSLALSADQKILAVGAQDKLVKLFGATDGKPAASLAGQAEAITNVAISRDNLRVAATAVTGNTIVWNVTGEVLDELSLLEGQASAVAFSSDNLALIIGGSDGKTHILPPSLQRQITGSKQPIRTIAYTPDGASILIGGDDNLVQLWTLADGKAVRSFAGAGAAVTSLALSTDGTKLYAGSADKSLRMWTVADGKLLTTTPLPSAIASVCLSVDGLRVAVGGADRVVRVLDTVTQKVLQKFAGHQKPITSLVFSPDGKSVISASSDTTIIRSPISATLVIAAHEGGVNALTMTADGTHLVSGGADKLVKLFDLAGKPVRQFAGATLPIQSVALRPDGLQLAATSDDKHVHFWTFANAAVERKVLLGGIAKAAAYSTDNTRLVVGADDKHLRVIDPTTGMILEDITTTAVVPALAFASDDRTVLAADALEKANLHQLALQRVLVGHAMGVTALAYTPDGLGLVSGGVDKTVRHWTVADGKPVRTISGHTATVTGVALTSDGARVVTSSEDMTVRVWTLANGAAVSSIAVKSPVRGMDLSSDSTRVVTGTDDMIVRLWDIASGKELQRWTGHTAATGQVALAADGRTVVTGSADKSVRTWHVALRNAIVADAGKIYDVEVLPDGLHIVTSGDDKIVKLWDLDGKPIRQFAGAAAPVRSIEVRADGVQIAGGSDPLLAQKNVLIWNVADAKVLHTLVTPAGVTRIGYSADHKLAVGGADKHVRVYASETAQLLQDFVTPEVLADVAFAADNKTLVGAGVEKNAIVLEYSLANLLVGHEGIVSEVAYSSDGKGLFTSGADKTVRLWNLADGKVVRNFMGSTLPVNDLHLTADGKRLIAGGDDKIVRVWDLATATAAQAQPVASYTQPVPIRAVSASGDGGTVMAAGDDGIIYSWDSASGKQLERMLGHAGQVLSLALSEDGRTLASGGVDKTAKRWSPSVVDAVTASEGPLADVAFAPDGSTIYTTGVGKVVKSWSAEGLKPGPNFSGAAVDLTSISVSPDGKVLAAGGTDPTAHLWTTDGKPLATVKTPSGIAAIVLGEAGKKLILAGADHIVRNYGLVQVDGKPVWQLVHEGMGHTEAITGLALADDEHTLFTVSADKTAKRWFAASGASRLNLSGHEQAIYDLDFSASGQRLASASGDKSARMWDLTTGETLVAFEGHERQVTGVDFRKGDHQLATTSLDGTVRMWSTLSNLPGPRPPMPKLDEAAPPAQQEDPTANKIVVHSTLRPQAVGLIAHRYKTPNHTGEFEIGVDKQMNLEWTEEDGKNFTTRWQGSLTVPAEGEITFTAEADDLVRLYLNGTLIIDGWDPKKPREAKLKVKAGDVLPIRVDHSQVEMTAHLRLFWSWEGHAKELIPAEAYSHQPLYAGDQIDQIELEDAGYTLRYSPDGIRLAAAGRDKVWKIWNLSNRVLERTNSGPNETIYRVAYNPVGNRLATIDYSGKLCVWDTTNATLRFHQQLPVSAAYSIAYSPDSTELLVGTSDARVLRALIPVPAR